MAQAGMKISMAADVAHQGAGRVVPCAGLQLPSRPSMRLSCCMQTSRTTCGLRQQQLGLHSPQLHVVVPAPAACPSQSARKLSGSSRLVPQAGLDLALLSTTTPALRDLVCCVAAGLGAKLWTKLFDVLVNTGKLEQKLSRKLVHITTGPIFLLTWPLFSMNPWACVLASLVPILNVMRILAVGLGFWEDTGFVNSVSRSGDRSELLKGPLYYCLVLIMTCLLCWRQDPTGMIVVCLMCGGDGLADIVGRRFGRGNNLPYNPSKSLAGSVAMLLGGTIMAAGLITVFCSLGYFECYSPGTLLPYLLAVSAIATVVESLPINQVLDDNLSVPLVSAIMAMALMPHAAAQAATLLTLPTL